VAVGSLGRGEVTSGSDVDFLLVATDSEPDIDRQDKRAALIDSVASQVTGLGLLLPNKEGPLADVAFVPQLCSNISKDPDSNQVLTRRMLLVLESAPFMNPDVADRALQAIRETYLSLGLKDNRPPRFFLNDVIRYWRTLCVDYEGKMRDRGMKGWALRNAKLRTVRKMLFASGMLPLLECHEMVASAMPDFLKERLGLSPAERVAASFITYESERHGADALQAYSTFLARLDDAEWRDELSALSEDDRASSAAWAEAKELGRGFEAGLMHLLFESRLAPVARTYLVF
jgi:hypothetical protein